MSYGRSYKKRGVAYWRRKRSARTRNMYARTYRRKRRYYSKTALKGRLAR